MQLGDIRAAVEAQLDISTVDSWTDTAQLNGYINRSIRAFDAAADWWWLERTVSFPESVWSGGTEGGGVLPYMAIMAETNEGPVRRVLQVFHSYDPVRIELRRVPLAEFRRYAAATATHAMVWATSGRSLPGQSCLGPPTT